MLAAGTLADERRHVGERGFGMPAKRIYYIEATALSPLVAEIGRRSPTASATFRSSRLSCRVISP